MYVGRNLLCTDVLLTVSVSFLEITVRIATQTTPWCVARSGCNQRGSIALRNRGTPVLMSAICHNRTSCRNFRRLLRERVRCPTAQRFCHREVGTSPRHHAPHSLDTFGKKTSKFKTHNSFEAKSTEMRPVTALIEYKQAPSGRNMQILRSARIKVQQTARRCTNEYWTQLRQDIQTAAITGNIREHQGNV